MTWRSTVINSNLKGPKDIDIDSDNFQMNSKGEVKYLGGMISQKEMEKELENMIKKGVQGNVEVQMGAVTDFSTYYLMDNKLLVQEGKVVYEGDLKTVSEVNELEHMVNKRDMNFEDMGTDGDIIEKNE